MEFLPVTILFAELSVRAGIYTLQLVDLYGLSGIVLAILGSQTTWRLQAQVLGKANDQDALEFKKSVQDQCSMVSIAAAIVAQISITALVLPSLNQTHWVAKGFLNYSLVAALIAVYYSTTQHRIVGRFLKPQQIRLWIRGGLPNAAGNITNGGLIGLYPSTLLAIVLKYFPHLIPPSVKKRLDTFNGIYRKFITLNLVSFQDPSRIPFRERYPRIARRLFGVPRSWLPRDPSEFTVQNLSEEGIKECLQHSCFTPSASAVITISAAQILLTSSLFSLLIALGIYFGFIWTRNLDTSAGPKESKNVFIMFVTSLGACLVVFLFSRIIQDQDTRTERKILEDYMAEYVQDPENRDTVSGWGVSYRVDSDGVKFSLAPTSNV